ncbi:Histone deacetylase 1 [Trichinella zimbabwensis]|uniref:Histone deacetylase n=1 Tax=Trichinella zimbabwensis TaxID=268475 RepID=A0A0V1GUT4_9BILA|nr:Histone deacetylase 1 [Trichinella zimbabwensis]
MSRTDDSKKRVSYFYDPDIGNYMFSPNHDMKPIRVRMVHCLVYEYQLYRQVTIMEPHRATPDEMKIFHDEDYIDMLRRAKPEHMNCNIDTLSYYNIGDDCPLFDGIFEYCQITTGGSIAGAQSLNSGEYDIAINWAGGMHHAKWYKASGFCFVNDIVLAILQLLKKHQRVLYVDIDCHHGDGVEEAFYTTDRVMTVSFHKFGNFFPGTGNYDSIGYGNGLHYAVNFPLLEGITDLSYMIVFRGVISKVVERFRPNAIVMQCGADSLAMDRLGCFNLTVAGHGELVKYIRSFNLPLLLLGGGGYTLSNVGRCWTYETAVAAGVEISNELPICEHYSLYAPTYTLHTPPTNMEDKNTRSHLETISSRIYDSLRYVCAPSAPLTG